MIKTLDQVTEFPLCWPESKPRTSERRPSSFKATLAKARAEIEREMGRWGALDYVLSLAPAYRRGASDPGVALWWTMAPIGSLKYELFVLACDTYQLQEHNLHAVALTLEYLRGCERYGTYTLHQAAQGARAALPPPAEAATLDWRVVLGGVPHGLDKDDALAIVNGRYRKLSAEVNSDEAEQRRLNLAVEAARAELRT